MFAVLAQKYPHSRESCLSQVHWASWSPLQEPRFSVFLPCPPWGQHLAQIPQGGPLNICVSANARCLPLLMSLPIFFNVKKISYSNFIFNLPIFRAFTFFVKLPSKPFLGSSPSINPKSINTSLSFPQVSWWSQCSGQTRRASQWAKWTLAWTTALVPLEQSVSRTLDTFVWLWIPLKKLIKLLLNEMLVQINFKSIQN